MAPSPCPAALSRFPPLQQQLERPKGLLLMPESPLPCEFYLEIRCQCSIIFQRPSQYYFEAIFSDHSNQIPLILLNPSKQSANQIRVFLPCLRQQWWWADIALLLRSIMLTPNEKRLMQFKEALRAYEACRPFCLPAGDQSHRLACFEQCSRKHRELADKLRVTLQYNIE